MYNRIEAEYPSIDKNDQTDIVIVDTPSGDRNPNEPDNPLQTRYDLVNENSRVHGKREVNPGTREIKMLSLFNQSHQSLILASI